MAMSSTPVVDGWFVVANQRLGKQPVASSILEQFVALVGQTAAFPPVLDSTAVAA